MCSYIVEKAGMIGTAKGPNSRWMRIDTANVYYDIPTRRSLITRSASILSARPMAAANGSPSKFLGSRRST